MNIRLITATTFLILFTLNCSPYSRPEPAPVAKEKAFDSYLQGLEAYRIGNYETAMEYVEKALEINNHFAQFYDLKGNIHMALGDNDKALDAFYRALSYRSNYTAVLVRIGEIYSSRGDYLKAIQFFNKAFSSDNTAYTLYLNLADSYLQMGDYTLALFSLKEYQRFLDKNKDQPEKRFHTIAGEIYFHLARYKDSITELNKVEKTDNVLYLLGRNYYALNDFDTGLIFFNMLRNRNKNEGLWYFYRAVYFYHKNNYEDALSQFKQALILNPSLYDSYYFIGKIHEKNKDYRSAWESFRLFRESMKEHDELRYINEKIFLPDDLYMID